MNSPNSPHPEELLNEYQARRVKIILTLFEEDLFFALRWLDGNPEEGSIYQRKLVLSDDLRKTVGRFKVDGWS